MQSEPTRSVAAAVLQALAARGVPGCARVAAPWDEAAIFDVIKRAADETWRRPGRRHLVGLESLLQRFPEAHSHPAWRASAGVRTTAPGEMIELIGYRDDATLVDVSRYLPAERHATFDAYAAYLDGLGSSIGFQSPGIQAASPELAVGLRSMVKPFLSRTELRSCYLNVFFGNYRSTPFGVHVDAHHEHVFHLVLCGAKELWAWNALDLARLADPGVVLGTSPPGCDYPVPPTRLIAGPGEVLYWPGHFAHCMVVEGSSMGVSLVLEPVQAEAEQVLLSIGLAEQPAGAAPCLKPFGAQAQRSLDDAIAVARMRCRSIGGLINVRPLCSAERSEAIDGEVEPSIDPDFPLETLELSDGRLVIAVNGLCFEWHDLASKTDLRHLLAQLERPVSLPARELYERHVSSRLDVGDVTAVLRFCAAAGAIRIEPDVASAAGAQSPTTAVRS